MRSSSSSTSRRWTRQIWRGPARSSTTGPSRPEASAARAAAEAAAVAGVGGQADEERVELAALGRRERIKEIDLGEPGFLGCLRQGPVAGLGQLHAMTAAVDRVRRAP